MEKYKDLYIYILNGVYVGLEPGLKPISNVIREEMKIFYDLISDGRVDFLQCDYSYDKKITSSMIKKYINEEDKRVLEIALGYKYEKGNNIHYSSTLGLKHISFNLDYKNKIISVNLNVTTEFLRYKEVLAALDINEVRFDKKLDMDVNCIDNIWSIVRKVYKRYKVLINIFVVDYWKYDRSKQCVNSGVYVIDNVFFYKNMSRFKKIKTLKDIFCTNFLQLINFKEHQVYIKCRYLYLDDFKNNSSLFKMNVENIINELSNLSYIEKNKILKCLELLKKGYIKYNVILGDYDNYLLGRLSQLDLVYDILRKKD